MLSDRDQELIAAASEAIKRRYRNDWQEVGAALRTRDGRPDPAVNGRFLQLARPSTLAA